MYDRRDGDLAAEKTATEIQKLIIEAAIKLDSSQKAAAIN